MEQKRCISSLTLAELSAELKALGQPGFRAKQIFHWVHQKLVTEFSAMTDQPKTLLAKLEEAFYIAAPQIERRQEAKDGTVKYLLRMADGNCIETVVMRYHYGNTVCVSTQVGCRMGCRFCASTQAGRVRNLEAGEICSEIYTAQKDIGERISHIVLMGIGEPLDNSGKHHLAGGRQHRHAQHQPVYLRSGAQDRHAGRKEAAAHPVGVAARPQ